MENFKTQDVSRLTQRVPVDLDFTLLYFDLKEVKTYHHRKQVPFFVPLMSISRKICLNHPLKLCTPANIPKTLPDWEYRYFLTRKNYTKHLISPPFYHIHINFEKFNCKRQIDFISPRRKSNGSLQAILIIATVGANHH